MPPVVDNSPASAGGTEVTNSPPGKSVLTDAPSDSNDRCIAYGATKDDGTNNYANDDDVYTNDDNYSNGPVGGPRTHAHSTEGQPIPTTTTSEHQGQFQMTSPNFPGARELVDMSASSPGNESIHSWNEPCDQELLWEGTPNCSINPSPPTRQEILMGGFNTPSNYYQVTPPLQRRPSPHSGSGSGRNMPPMPYRRQLDDGNGDDDGGGLSVADLCYLTEQNRILLQAQGKLSK